MDPPALEAKNCSGHCLKPSLQAQLTAEVDPKKPYHLVAIGLLSHCWSDAALNTTR
jgi:hypothetical protein